LSESFKICPICGSPNHPKAVVCHTCGTALRTAEIAQQPTAPVTRHRAEYDYRHGETDLFEANLRRTGQLYLVGGLIVLAVITCGGLFFLLRILLAPLTAEMQAQDVPVATASHTPRPTIILATVTPGPPTPIPTLTPSQTPTATISPTPEPCIQKVAAGDDLISLAFRCGHRSLDVIDLILDLNNLSDAGNIQIGQEIVIPWPTPTEDPNAVPTEVSDSSSSTGVDTVVAMVDGEIPTETPMPFDPFGPSPTWTLQPGVMWHQVVSGETIISIAVQYGANVEILSQLNPEITFSQCDFGLESGGGSCIVNLYQGQLMRVPAPTATPTLPPTPSGSETATPTPTATFNAPSPLSPDDRAFFARDQLVTLRWIATGAFHAADSQELFIIVPVDWQGTDDQRYEYQWTVNVIDANKPGEPTYTTEPRTFIWEGKGEGSS
jgi:hypothetical protein